LKILSYKTGETVTRTWRRLSLVHTTTKEDLSGSGWMILQIKPYELSSARSLCSLSQPEKEEFGDVIRLLKRDLTVTSKVAIFRFTFNIDDILDSLGLYVFKVLLRIRKLVIVYMREDIPDEYRK